MCKICGSTAREFQVLLNKEADRTLMLYTLDMKLVTQFT